MTADTLYRGYRIYFDPPPIGIRTSDWQFVHEDYDGSPDGNDHRCGDGATLQDCKDSIDWMEDDQ